MASHSSKDIPESQTRHSKLIWNPCSLRGFQQSEAGLGASEDSESRLRRCKSLATMWRR